ncbi:14529_t:CDS:2 [Funneliformis geosporum]|uniref:RING-type E3 ubiquitin transferase n=1 Tax=Funneliformis geosporum TaxID=1117311 RepID=A0A9W4SP40_9GLOM|nr:14529_t:CDS:2 [Funneliformis geosporum]CAI2177452.1 9373_t:CDS:2 [Funneliformis geosporum]
MSDRASESNNSSANRTANSRSPYFCHQCHVDIEPLMAPNPTCPRCNGEFVEEIVENNDLREFVEHGGGQETDDEFDDTQFPTGNPQNGLNEILQLIQSMLRPNTPVRVQTESRDGTTTTTITATGSTIMPATGNTVRQDEGQNTSNTSDDRASPPFDIAQMLENFGANNAANFMNIFNIAGDPADYAWNNTGFDNIISQLMEQQAGRQAPPPATDEMIENLPKTKISKKQIVEEQLGCPVCKDEFKIGEEAVDLPCTHTFHYDCIKPWLKMNGTCPVCRYSLIIQDNNEQNGNDGTGSSGNNNSNRFSSAFRFNSNSSLPGTYPGNQQNNGQNRQGDSSDHMDLDHEPVD